MGALKRLDGVEKLIIGLACLTIVVGLGAAFNSGALKGLTARIPGMHAPSISLGTTPPSTTSPSGGAPAVTSTPTPDPRLAQAVGTPDGQKAIAMGLAPSTVIPAQDQRTVFLNSVIEGDLKLASFTDTYVVFNDGKPPVDSPPQSGGVSKPLDYGYVVGLAKGVVGLEEDFDDGRGSVTCYAPDLASLQQLQASWLPLNQYIKGQSLGQRLSVDSTDVPGFNRQLTCYLSDAN